MGLISEKIVSKMRDLIKICLMIYLIISKCRKKIKVFWDETLCQYNPNLPQINLPNLRIIRARKEYKDSIFPNQKVQQEVLQRQICCNQIIQHRCFQDRFMTLIRKQNHKKLIMQSKNKLNRRCYKK